jgi:hypothetical protein
MSDETETNLMHRLAEDYRRHAEGYIAASELLLSEAKAIEERGFVYSPKPDDYASLTTTYASPADYLKAAGSPYWRSALGANDIDEHMEISHALEKRESELLVPSRKAAAGPAFDHDIEFYTGVLEEEPYSLTYGQAEEVVEYLRECFGAYKLEFTWGTAGWSDFSDAPSTSFGYTRIVGDPEDDYRVYGEDHMPVIIRFDLPDLRSAVRDHATSADEDGDAGNIMCRQEMVTKLQTWQLEIGKLITELETELKELRGWAL